MMNLLTIFCNHSHIDNFHDNIFFGLEIGHIHSASLCHSLYSMYGPQISLNFPQNFLILQPHNTLYFLTLPEPTTLSRLFIAQSIRHNGIFMTIVPIVAYCIFTHIWRICILLLFIIDDTDVYRAVITACLRYHLQCKTVLLLVNMYRSIYYELTLLVKLSTSDVILVDCEICSWWVGQTMK